MKNRLIRTTKMVLYRAKKPNPNETTRHRQTPHSDAVASFSPSAFSSPTPSAGSLFARSCSFFSLKNCSNRSDNQCSTDAGSSRTTEHASLHFPQKPPCHQSARSALFGCYLLKHD